MSINKSTFWMMLLASLCFPQNSSAQASGAPFLKIDPSPSSFAMGNSAVVTSWGAQAISYGNPANLGLMNTRFQAFTSYASLMNSEQYGHIAAAMALPASIIPVDSVGLSLTRLQIGGIDGTDSAGNSTGDSSQAADMAAALSASGKIPGARMLRYGLTGEAVNSQLGPYHSNTALAASFGLSYSMPQLRGLMLSGSVSHLGQPIRYISESNPLPTSLNAGAAMALGPVNLALSVNRMVQDSRTNVGFGAGYSMGPISFKAGYLAQEGIGTNLAQRDQKGLGQFASALSGGVGMQVGSAHFDYAVSQAAADYSPTQRVALSMQWGDKGALAQPGRPSQKNTIIQQNPWNDSQRNEIDWRLIQQ